MCPIHGGTNKTLFRVSASKNCWNCFGKCQAGGNIIDFVARKEDIPFRDAALLIDEWFPGGSSDPSDREQKPRFNTSKVAVAEAPQRRKTVHEEKPTPAEEDDGEPSKPLAFALTKLDAEHPYFAERGLTAETIATFGLGFCNKGLLRGMRRFRSMTPTAILSPMPAAGQERQRMAKANTSCPRDSRRALSFSIIIEQPRATRLLHSSWSRDSSTR